MTDAIAESVPHEIIQVPHPLPSPRGDIALMKQPTRVLVETEQAAHAEARLTPEELAARNEAWIQEELHINPAVTNYQGLADRLHTSRYNPQTHQTEPVPLTLSEQQAALRKGAERCRRQLLLGIQAAAAAISTQQVFEEHNYDTFQPEKGSNNLDHHAIALLTLGEVYKHGYEYLAQMNREPALVIGEDGKKHIQPLPIDDSEREKILARTRALLEHAHSASLLLEGHSPDIPLPYIVNKHFPKILSEPGGDTQEPSSIIGAHVRDEGSVRPVSRIKAIHY